MLRDKLMHGGLCGTWFTDWKDSCRLSGIRIQAGRYIDSIQCEFADGTTSARRGGEGGKQYLFAPDDDNEAIITIFIWCNEFIEGLQFQTITGRLSPKYGGGEGVPYVISGVSVNGTRSLAGFSGRSAALVDALEPIWAPNFVNTKCIVKGPAKGPSTRGIAFNNILSIQDPLKSAIKTIRLFSGHWIDSIQFQYWDGEWGVKIGGTGGEPSVFELHPGERITKLEGRAGDLIDGLAFITDQGRIFGPFGHTQRGTPFTWLAPQTGNSVQTDMQMSLVTFSGTHGPYPRDGGVYNLVPIWAADLPVSYELNINSLSFHEAIREIKEVKVETDRIDNFTADASRYTFSFDRQASSRSTVSLSSASRTKIGAKVTFEAFLKGKRGVPCAAEGDVSSKAGIRLSTEQEWSTATTDGDERIKSFKRTTSCEHIISPGKGLLVTAIFYEHEIKRLPWAGTMNVTYSTGNKQAFPVEGVLNTVNHSHATTVTQIIENPSATTNPSYSKRAPRHGYLLRERN